ncbi:MAG: hypothetical protein IKV35_04840, partial [Clostridia bacterium]|nr:hypothetical protein [Clostridia bacterium]
MKLYKKLLCGALAAAMVLSMAACDSKPKTRDYSDDDDDDTPSTTTTTTTGEEGEDGEDDPPGRLLDFCLTIPDDYMKAENEALKLTGTKNELKDYSANIKLPRIAKAKVTVMMSIDWQYLQKNNVEGDPFAQYHATLMWRNVNADQAGDVEIVRVAENEMTDRVVTATATGTAPDILPANYDLTYPRWNAAGLTASLVPYKDYLGLNEQFYYEDLYNRDFL